MTSVNFKFYSIILAERQPTLDSASFFNLISTVAILVLLIATGYICRKARIIDNTSSKNLSKFIISVGQPMMIISALIGKEFSWERAKSALMFLILGFILFPLMALIGLLFSGFYKDKEARKINLFATTFTNSGFIGFPILEAIFPERGAFNGAFFIMGFHVYMWTLGIFILSKDRYDIKLTPKKAIINYGTIPCTIAFAMYFLKAVIPIPTVVIDFTSLLSNLCLPISVIITGALIATQKPMDILKNPQIYIFNIIKLIVTPVIVCLIAKLCTLGMADSYILVIFSTIIAALPSGATLTMLCELYDINPAYAAQTVGSSSILSAFTLPFLCLFADFIAKL